MSGTLLAIGADVGALVGAALLLRNLRLQADDRDYDDEDYDKCCG